MKQRFYNAILVLIGARKVYNPKTHFVSRLSGPRNKKPFVLVEKEGRET
jgi:hypothetical protein